MSLSGKEDEGTGAHFPPVSVLKSPDFKTNTGAL